MLKDNNGLDRIGRGLRNEPHCEPIRIPPPLPPVKTRARSDEAIEPMPRSRGSPYLLNVNFPSSMDAESRLNARLEFGLKTIFTCLGWIILQLKQDFLPFLNFVYTFQIEF